MGARRQGPMGRQALGRVSHRNGLGVQGSERASGVPEHGTGGARRDALYPRPGRGPLLWRGAAGLPLDRPRPGEHRDGGLHEVAELDRAHDRLRPRAGEELDVPELPGPVPLQEVLRTALLQRQQFRQPGQHRPDGHVLRADREAGGRQLDRARRPVATGLRLAAGEVGGWRRLHRDESEIEGHHLRTLREHLELRQHRHHRDGRVLAGHDSARHQAGPRRRNSRGPDQPSRRLAVFAAHSVRLQVRRLEQSAIHVQPRVQLARELRVLPRPGRQSDGGAGIRLPRRRQSIEDGLAVQPFVRRDD